MAMATTSQLDLAKSSDSIQSEDRLSSLPYDIRYLIYTHLFPQTTQIYIQILPNQGQLTCTPPGEKIPTAILRINRQINAEASAFLYNNYLFNIVGRKCDCLGLYKGFQETLRRYARQEVLLHAFSNGAHSDTMGVSLQTGTGRMEELMRRGRGVLKDIEELEQEVEDQKSRWARWRSFCGVGTGFLVALSALVATMAFFFR